MEAGDVTPVQANQLVSAMFRSRRRAIAPPITLDNMTWAVLVTEKNMRHPDGRVSNGAVKNLLAMNAQLLLMDREEAEAAKGEIVQPGGTVNNFNGPTQINSVEMSNDTLLARIARVAAKAKATGDSGASDPGRTFGNEGVLPEE